MMSLQIRSAVVRQKRKAKMVSSAIPCSDFEGESVREIQRETEGKRGEKESEEREAPKWRRHVRGRKCNVGFGMTTQANMQAHRWRTLVIHFPFTPSFILERDSSNSLPVEVKI